MRFRTPCKERIFIFWFATSLLSIHVFVSCKPSKIANSDKSFRKLSFLFRDADTGTPKSGVQLQIHCPETTFSDISTDNRGFAEHKLKGKKAKSIDQCELEWTTNALPGTIPLKGSIPLSNFIHFYDIYINDPNKISNKPIEKIADFHLQTTMRVQNLFGHPLFDTSEVPAIPQNLNWYKDYDKLDVFNGKCWKKASLGCYKDDSAKAKKMKILLDGEQIRSKGGSNKLTHYTQATYSQLKEGNIALSYNPICPFEKNVAGDWKRKLVNKYLVTGAPMKWLNKIGKNFTHKKSLELEFYMMGKLNNTFNDFSVIHYEGDTSVLDKYNSVIVNYVEGSHVLQDRYFPHTINYNIGNRSRRESERLYEEIHEKLPPVPIQTTGDTKAKQEKITADEIRRSALDSFIDSVLIDELSRNITWLKEQRPTIWMMTISHLTYNGMTGHAPALDQGKFPNNVVAKRSYALRVSDDKALKAHWQSAFYTIPGVNKYGDTVIQQLLDTSNGHRILIDLKHSDPITRQYFFENIMKPSCNNPANDTIPPICTHCAVTGLPLSDYSPNMDEYVLTHSPVTTEFYPFGINLYNEEIEMICQHGGMIGINLEQRALGSYINRKILRESSIRVNGELRMDKYELPKDQLIKRWPYTRRWLRRYDYMKKEIPILNKRFPQILNEYSVRPELVRKARNRFYHDYKSLEPFLRNLFHMIDHSGYDNPDLAWKHFCLGSDLDGLIDPIDICPTAGQYPIFKERLKTFIPIFLELRQDIAPGSKFKEAKAYFDDEKELDNAINQLFYESLKKFTVRTFKKSAS